MTTADPHSPAPATPSDTGASVCRNHHMTVAEAHCRACGAPACGLCVVGVNSRVYCSACAVGRAPQHPWLAALFSVALPGAGQVYNGRFDKGALFFLTAPLVVPWVWGVVDAAQDAEAIASGKAEASTVPTGIVLVVLKLVWLPVALVYGFAVVALFALIASGLS